jgi:hypothetical protein
VLVLDAAGTRARARRVERGPEPLGADELVPVLSGLDPSDKVILDADVEPGDAVRARDEADPR